MKDVKPHYSGKLSRPFWERVNNLKNQSDRQQIYSLGVALQNHEEYVLRMLAIKKQKSPKP